MTVLAGADAQAIRPDSVLYRALEDGRELVVYQMLPGQFRLVLGEQDSMFYDDAYCFHGLGDVLEALADWKGDGDPPGRWYRHIRTGRRREFDAEGNLVREYINP